MGGDDRLRDDDLPRERDGVDPWEMPGAGAPPRRSGMSTGFKVVLASVFGCGGCLALAIVAILALGASFLGAIEDARPASVAFVDALIDGRADDALLLIDREQRGAPRVEEQLAETIASIAAVGRYQRRSDRGLHRSVTDEGSFFRMHARTYHEGGELDWTIWLVERDEAWFVHDWKTAVRVDDSISGEAGED